MPSSPTNPLNSTGNVSTAGAATTTGSITYAGTDAYYILSYAALSGAAFTATTTVSGMSLTWAKKEEVIKGNYVLGVWVGYGGAGANGAVTITFSRTPTSGRYNIAEHRGFGDTSVDPIQQSANNNGTGTTGSVSLTPTKGLFEWSFFMHAVNEAVTPDSTGSTWTELSDTGGTTISLELQYLNGATDLGGTASATWLTSSDWAAVAMEYKNFSHSADARTSATDYLVAASTGKSTLPGAHGSSAVSQGDGNEDDGGSTPGGVWAIVG